MAAYLLEEKSCDQVGWETSSEEGEGHRHLVHKVVNRISEKVSRVMEMAEKQVQMEGLAVWGRAKVETVRHHTEVKSKEKESRLVRLKAAVLKFAAVTQERAERVVGVLHIRAMQLMTPCSLLGTARGVLFKAPHKWGYAVL